MMRQSTAFSSATQSALALEFDGKWVTERFLALRSLCLCAGYSVNLVKQIKHETTRSLFINSLTHSYKYSIFLEAASNLYESKVIKINKMVAFSFYSVRKYSNELAYSDALVTSS